MTGVAGSSRPILVWALLAAATIGSWLLGTSHGASVDAAQVGTALALALGFLKGRYIGLELMELRTASPLLRWIFEGWVVLVGLSLTGLYLVG